MTSVLYLQPGCWPSSPLDPLPLSLSLVHFLKPPLQVSEQHFSEQWRHSIANLPVPLLPLDVDALLSLSKRMIAIAVVVATSTGEEHPVREALQPCQLSNGIRMSAGMVDRVGIARTHDGMGEPVGVDGLLFFGTSVGGPQNVVERRVRWNVGNRYIYGG